MKTRQIGFAAALSLLASTAGALADPSPGLATFSLDTNDQANGVIVTDHPQSGTLDPSNLPSSSLNSTPCSGNPTTSCTNAQITGGPRGVEAFVTGIAEPNTNRESATASAVFYFEIQTNGSASLPSSLVLDLSPYMTAFAAIDPNGGSASARADLTIGALGFAITLKEGCSVIEGNPGQQECGSANNFGVTHNGIAIINNGTQTFTPAPATVVSSNSSVSGRINFSDMEQIVVNSSFYNTPIQVLLSATGSAGGALGGGDFTAISDPIMTFDPLDLDLPDFTLLVSPNLPAAVPEPASLYVLGPGLLGLIAFAAARRRKTKAAFSRKR